MRIVDLFCGCGGFSLGFILANPQYRISLAIDNDFRAIHTYVKNIEVGVTLTKDIRKIHSNEILDLMNPYNPDIVIASPPCEPFSIANPNRQKSAYNQLYMDKIGRLILDAIRIIIDLEPIVFLIENVLQFMVVSFCPEVTSVQSIDQLGSYSHPVFYFPNAAFKHVLNPEILAHLLNFHGISFVGKAGVSSDHE